jgi:hypothetical protein
MLKSEDRGITVRYQQSSYVNSTGLSSAMSRFQASK